MVGARRQDPGSKRRWDWWRPELIFAKRILKDVDAGVLNDVLSFVRDTSPQTCGQPLR